MDQIPCPDGYLLDPRSPLAEGHHALNQYLVRVEEAGWAIALKEINGIRDKGKKLVIWKALIERFRWLQEHNSGQSCRSPLRGLAERIEKWTLAPTQTDLIEILDKTPQISGFVQPYTPVPHLLAYIEEKGLTPELAAAIRRFREQVYQPEYSVNQVSLQMFRSRLDMLAWRDEWTPIDPKRCWSEQVRADFRAMTGAERENWRKLLHSINGDEGTRPAPKWLSQAQNIIATIGQSAFRDRLLRWFTPLQRGAKVKLSREGSFLLRALMWLAESLNDAEVLARIDEIGDVEFKPKTNGEKVMRAAAQALGKPDPTVKPAAPLPSIDSLIGRALSAVLRPGASPIPAELASRIEIAGEVVNVRGQLDTYKVHISTGAIFRSSDGKRVHIQNGRSILDVPGIPDIAGMSELISQILILADDVAHRSELIAGVE